MATAVALSVNDPSSYSEPEKAQVRSLDWDVTINFQDRTIAGFANLTVDNKVDFLDNLVLDVRDLTVEEVTLKETGRKCTFDISNPYNVKFGSKLTIDLGQVAERSFTVSIKYKTSPSSSALQWLRPEQTAGKRQPYLFSQCEAIHARSLLPCQDTPSVKFTYTAKVAAPKGITVLMSAVRIEQPVQSGDSNLTFQFKMAVPIPSYLIAIVAGDLESRVIGPRSRVWSEKELVEAAAFEFSETEAMLQTAERLMGPYVWEVYDLLVLPPSFPFGGMENPCLTFVTPTVLAGDRSLADVIAHEISHSWTGNLVTNRTFEHFWLNEGYTRFVERKIVTLLKENSLYFDLLVGEGLVALRDVIKSLTEAGEAPYTKLVPDLRGVDPDNAFSTVPYEKGFALLYHLETLLGGPAVFEPFLRAYIEHFKFQSINTADWKKFLYDYFSSQEDRQKLDTVDWDTWLYGLGLPPYQPKYDLSLAEPSNALARRWIEQPDDQLNVFSPGDISGFPSILVREFLSQIYLQEPPLSLTKVKQLETLYKFNQVRNSEIRFRWLRLCIQVQWPDCVSHVLNFLNEQGRMKFVRPLYRDMYAWDYGRSITVANFLKHRHEMHNTTAGLVAKDLHLEE